MPAGKTITDVTVVIRAVGERTEAACRHLAAQQVPPENIVVVSNAPFSATLADSYRAGIVRGLAWTLCIDADVLLGSGAVARLLDAAGKADAAVWEIQGMVLDKFFGIRRPAGNHLYRTALLPKALGLIPVDGVDIRPEYHTLNKMADARHPWLQTTLVVGLHDFEQSYQDIFRKCHVHAHKHLGLIHLLIEYWRQMAQQDDDYRVALRGLAAGIVETGEVRVDVRRDYGFSRCGLDADLAEKETLKPDQITAEQVDRILASWPTPRRGLQEFAKGCAKATINGKEWPRTNSRGEGRSIGPWRMIPRSIGRAFGTIGRELERLANR